MAKIKLNQIKLKKYGQFGYAFEIPAPKSQEHLGPHEVALEATTDLSKRDIQKLAAYIKRALVAYKKQKGK